MTTIKDKTILRIQGSGLTINIDSIQLFESLVSPDAIKFLENLIRHRMNEIVVYFQAVHDRIQEEKSIKSTEYYDSLKRNRDPFIYEYASYIRNFPIFEEMFDEIYNQNPDVLETIRYIWHYNELYGYQQPSYNSF